MLHVRIGQLAPAVLVVLIVGVFVDQHRKHQAWLREDPVVGDWVSSGVQVTAVNEELLIFDQGEAQIVPGAAACVVPQDQPVEILAMRPDGRALIQVHWRARDSVPASACSLKGMVIVPLSTFGRWDPPIVM